MKRAARCGTIPAMSEGARPAVVLAICCTSLFLVTMDITIVNLALPAIGRELGASVSGLQWAIDGYTVVLASSLVVAGATADRFGRKRVFQAGLGLFVAGSLLCSLASSVAELVAFRVVQALGGSMLNPVAMSILVNVFAEPAARARAIGVWGSVVGISMAVGPLIGGLLVEAVGWRAIFWINAPVGLGAILLTRRYVQESRAEAPRRPDLPGLALLVIGLGALTSCLIEGRRLGWGSPPIVVGLAIAALACAGFVAHERRGSRAGARFDPLVDLRFFRSLPFAAAAALAIGAFAMFNGGLFLSSLYLQGAPGAAGARGLGPVDAGLCLLPTAAGLIVCSRLSGHLVATGRARQALVAAGGLLSGGALLLVELAATTPLWQVLVSFGLTGMGFGLVNAPITHAAVSGMPRAQAGVAAAIASTSRQIGATLGVALSGTIAGAAHGGLGGLDFAAATRPFWWGVVVGGLGIGALGLYATSARAQRSAEQIAEELGR